MRPQLEKRELEWFLRVDQNPSPSSIHCTSLLVLKTLMEKVPQLFFSVLFRAFIYTCAKKNLTFNYLRKEFIIYSYFIFKTSILLFQYLLCEFRLRRMDLKDNKLNDIFFTKINFIKRTIKNKWCKMWKYHISKQALLLRRIFWYTQHTSSSHITIDLIYMTHT